jgi:endonuclease-3 related protein
MIFQQLLAHYGHQKWWPADSRDEIIIGAVLTQNTNWTNVEKAIANLKNAGACSLEACANLDLQQLQELIKPSGFYRTKALYLKEISKAIIKLQSQKPDLPTWRTFLLNLKGIGPETADSILLYAFHLPSFVIDAYTKRIFTRMEKFPPEIKYNQMQSAFQDNLPIDIELYNEYHGLIVHHAKYICKKTPLCAKCLWGELS